MVEIYRVVIGWRCLHHCYKAFQPCSFLALSTDHTYVGRPGKIRSLIVVDSIKWNAIQGEEIFSEIWSCICICLY